MVQRTMIRPPVSRMGPANHDERAQIIAASELKSKYTDTVDRISAYEVLKQKAEKSPEPPKAAKPARRSGRQSVGEAALKSAARTISNTLARELMRGLLGGLRRR